MFPVERPAVWPTRRSLSISHVIPQKASYTMSPTFFDKTRKLALLPLVAAFLLATGCR